MEGKEKWIKHYSSRQKILLVGEGDFSFSASLARAFNTATNMVATSLDSAAELAAKHRTSRLHLSDLRELDCSILHGVNVHTMRKNKKLAACGLFDRIIYNFPHSGYLSGFTESHDLLIERHKELLKGFFRSSRAMIGKKGEIHVSHRNDMLYRRWKIEKLAEEEGLALVGMVEFSKWDYPGYHNKRGDGSKSNKTFPLKEAFTFKFSKMAL